MLRSRLPLPILSCLFGAFLVVSSELLTGICKGLSNLPDTDPGVQHALAFAMQQYNLRSCNIDNNYKVVRIVTAQSQVDTRDEYHLSVDLEKTTCKKDSLSTTCKKQTCYFKVLSGPPQDLEITACT